MPKSISQGLSIRRDSYTFRDSLTLSLVLWVQITLQPIYLVVIYFMRHVLHQMPELPPAYVVNLVLGLNLLNKIFSGNF